MVKFVAILFYTLTHTTTASFYSNAHHGKKTASSEVYNMYKLTAAHKTLTFGTKVKVTNIENNKSVIVKINDRGPYIKGRDLDLSYAAFKSIADPKRGKIKVEYSILEKEDGKKDSL